MKKNTARMTALLLVLVMMLGMAGCGDQSKIVGTWEAELDFAPIFNESLGSGEDAAYLTVDSLVFKMVLTFTKDGTYTMAADTASVDAAMDSLRESLMEGMERYLVDTIAATGLHLEIDDIMEMLNTNMDALIDQVVTPELIEKMTASMAAKGNYKVEDGKLYMSDSFSKEIDENIYDTYILEEDTLTLETSTQDDALTEMLYPMVFTRAS